MFMEEIWMIDDVLTEKEKEFKEKVLQIEKESISNIVKVDDKIMVSKIIRMYEEENKE